MEEENFCHHKAATSDPATAPALVLTLSALVATATARADSRRRPDAGALSRGTNVLRNDS